MTEGLICPVMTSGSDFLERCNGAQCAWWDATRQRCGILPCGDDAEARYWLTPKGWAAVERLRRRNGSRKLVEYLS